MNIYVISDTWCRNQARHHQHPDPCSASQGYLPNLEITFASARTIFMLKDKNCKFCAVAGDLSLSILILCTCHSSPLQPIHLKSGFPNNEGPWGTARGSWGFIKENHANVRVLTNPKLKGGRWDFLAVNVWPVTPLG